MDFARKGLLFGALSMLAMLGAGCSGEGDETTITNLVGQDPPIALFANTAYTQVDPTDTGSEGSNVKASLESLGFTVETFTGIDAASIKSATQGRKVLVIPELEVGDLDADLADDARAVIVNFVSGGGTLVLFGSSSPVNLINNSFGFSLADGSADEPYTLNTTDAAGTPFEGGPNELPYGNDTTGFDVTTLPGNALAIYTEDNVGDAIVAVLPYGSGRIVYLGYDWYDAIPIGSQGGGWNDVLKRAVRW